MVIRRRRRARAVGIIAAGALVLVALLLLGTVLWSGGESAVGGRHIKVESGEFVRTYRQAGQVHARLVTLVYNRVTGLITWLIPEGTQVKEGDVIVRIDETDMEQRYEDFMEQSFRPHKMALESDKAALKEKERELDLAVNTAEIDLELARLAKERFEANHQWDLEIARIDEELAAIDEQKARIDYDANHQLAEKALAAENVVKASHVDWLNAAAHFEEVRNRRRRLGRGPDAIQLRKHENRLKDSTENLGRARFNRDVTLSLKRLEVVDAEARYQRAVVDKRRRERDLDYCSVKAPAPGTVAYVNVWKGSGDLSPVRVGETRSRGQDLLKIADTSELQIRMVVPEADIGMIRKGQEAKVRFVAFPDLVLPAEVRKISPAAKDKNQLLGPLALAKSGQAVVRAFEVHLALLDKNARLRLGLTAEAEIEVERVEKAKVIPLSALLRLSGDTFVLVAEDGDLSLRPVRLGQVNESEVVVLEGLEEGEEVVDEPPFEKGFRERDL